MKKILKILAGLVIAYIIISFIGNILGVSSSKEDYTSSKSVETEQDRIQDSLQLIEEKRIEDSITTEHDKLRLEGIKELKSLRKETDEFKEASFYHDSRTPRYSNINFIYPYITQSDDRYYLRMKLQYKGSDWLFIQMATFLIDGEKMPITQQDWKRDNDHRAIWETLDISAKSYEIQLMDKISKSTKTQVRFQGTEYYDDRTLTSKEKSIMRKVLGIYAKLEPTKAQALYLQGD